MEDILEELNEGVAIFDNQLRVTFANEALSRMRRYERREIEDRTPDVDRPKDLVLQSAPLILPEMRRTILDGVLLARASELRRGLYLSLQLEGMNYEPSTTN